MRVRRAREAARRVLKTCGERTRVMLLAPSLLTLGQPLRLQDARHHERVLLARRAVLAAAGGREGEERREAGRRGGTGALVEHRVGQLRVRGDARCALYPSLAAPLTHLLLTWSATASCSFSPRPRSASAEILRRRGGELRAAAALGALSQLACAPARLLAALRRWAAALALTPSTPPSPAHLSQALTPCRQAPSMSALSSSVPQSSGRIHCGWLGAKRGTRRLVCEPGKRANQAAHKQAASAAPLSTCSQQARTVPASAPASPPL